MTVNWDNPLFDSKLHNILKYELPLANEKILSKNSECFITLSYEWDKKLDPTSIVAINYKISCSYCKMESLYKLERKELIARKDITKKMCFNFFCKHCPRINRHETLFLSNNKFTMLRTKHPRTKKSLERRKPPLEKVRSPNKRVKGRKRNFFSRSKFLERERSDYREIVEELEALSVSFDDISHDNVLRYAKKVKKDWFNIVKLKREMKPFRLFIKYKINFTFERDIVQGQLEESLRYLTQEGYLERRVSNNIELFRITQYGLKHSKYLDIIDLFLNYQSGQYIDDSKVLQVKTKISSDDILQYLKSVLKGKRSKKITFNQIKSEMRLANKFRSLASRKRTLIIDFLRKRNNSSKNLLNDLENKIKSIHDRDLTSMLRSEIRKLKEEKYIEPIGKAFKLTSRFQWLIIYVKKLLKGDLPFYIKLFGCFCLLVLLVVFFLIVST